jgi:sugar phosphate isomerase/epimerase
MFRTGICSITHRQLAIDEIIDLAVKCGLEGIEWGGDVHVPHGEIRLAEDVLDKTLAAGLLCPSYGSYYKVGVSEDEGLRFEDVLDTADALGVPLIRVWASNRNIEDATPEYVASIAAETVRLADLALGRGITLAYEFHRGSLTNTAAGCRQLLEAVDRQYVQTYWQPLPQLSDRDNVAALTGLLPSIRNIHVFHWQATADGHSERRPLAEGRDAWTAYLDALRASDDEHWLYLEFSMNDSTECTIEDAAILRSLVETR